MLFTHRGLSGPAVLQASSYLPETGGGEVSFDLAPEQPDFEAWLLAERELGRQTHLSKLLSERLPARVAQAFCEEAGPSRPLRQYPAKSLAALAARLRQWTIRPSGTEGYAKAEVTLGGIDTRDLSGKTMESRNHPGLYFIGEAVDVTGHLGGFNFQWAWASGYAAGCAVGG
jgi:predicted Rossmann fold flavoprotein